MSVIKGPCEICGSQDNLVTYETGSKWCFTPECKFNEKRILNTEKNLDLVIGTHSAIPIRRISQRTCEFFNYQVGVDKGESVQIANYNGAQKIRTKDKKFYWKGDTKNVTLFGKDKWNKGKTIVITEGEIDALSIAEANDCKWPVVSLPNGAQSSRKTLQSELDWLLGFESIILCFDSDEAGRTATETCVELFPPGKVKIASLSEKDANECLVKGKYEELTKLVFNAQEYRPDGIVWGSELDLSTIFQQEPRGYPIIFPIWNERTRGLPIGRITTIYARTGIGKTTLMKELIRGLIDTRPETKIACIFLEENQKFTAKSLIAMDYNIPVWKLNEDPKLLTLDQLKTSKEKLKNTCFYNHFGSMDSNRLFNLLEYLVIGKGIEVIMLDHISILISGIEGTKEGERKDIDKIMTQLRSFTERTGCRLVLATQLKRGDKDEPITEQDARGSGAIEHLSDFIITVNRNKRSSNPNLVNLELLKNRYVGDEGKIDELFYHKDTGRLLPVKLSDLNINDKENY